MAKGYPDYFGHSFFPQYGPLTRAQVYRNSFVAGTAFTDRIITGKGVLSGGSLHLTVDNTIVGFIIGISIDGSLTISSIMPSVSLPMKSISNGRLIKMTSFAYYPYLRVESQIMDDISFSESVDIISYISSSSGAKGFMESTFFYHDLK